MVNLGQLITAELTVGHRWSRKSPTQLRLELIFVDSRAPQPLTIHLIPSLIVSWICLKHRRRNLRTDVVAKLLNIIICGCKNKEAAVVKRWERRLTWTAVVRVELAVAAGEAMLAVADERPPRVLTLSAIATDTPNTGTLVNIQFTLATCQIEQTTIFKITTYGIHKTVSCVSANG